MMVRLFAQIDSTYSWTFDSDLFASLLDVLQSFSIFCSVCPESVLNGKCSLHI